MFFVVKPEKRMKGSRQITKEPAQMHSGLQDLFLSAGI
jgi:hypothetical protein